MSQRIEIVPGDDITGQSLQDIFHALVQPGILQGFELQANETSVRIKPGVGVMDSGVFIYEDEEIDTNALSLGSGPQDFTVLYMYVPSKTFGGEPASLRVEAGLLDPNTFRGGLILGWIRHSGGPGLKQKDFIQGRRIKLGIPREKIKDEFVVSFAPLSTKWAQASGDTLSVVEGWNTNYNGIVTALSNSTASLQIATYYFPILIPATGLGQLLLESEIPNIANLQVSLIDTAGVEYMPPPPPNATSNMWTLTARPMERKIMSVPQNLTLERGKVAYMKMHMNLQSGATLRFKTIGFSSYTEPF